MLPIGSFGSCPRSISRTIASSTRGRTKTQYDGSATAFDVVVDGGGCAPRTSSARWSSSSRATFRRAARACARPLHRERGARRRGVERPAFFCRACNNSSARRASTTPRAGAFLPPPLRSAVVAPPPSTTCCCAAFVLSLLLVLFSPLVLSTLRLRLFYGDFSRTGAPALYTHAL